MLPKAHENDFTGRFREIVSDPINIAIKRNPKAGFVESGFVYLHNGLKVPVSGPHSYYGNFSAILVINRGVHEPLEEYLFQEVLKSLPDAPTMIELGAYWGHYSMWLLKTFPNADLHLVEPEKVNFEAGMKNFLVNGFKKGKFTNDFVGNGRFSVDAYFKKNKIEKLDILHSDIQGYELEMLADCQHVLSNRLVDRVFVSTHSCELHQGTIDSLDKHGYRIEVSSNFDAETTSCDGLVFASSPNIAPIFSNLAPMGRLDILESSPLAISEYVSRIVKG